MDASLRTARLKNRVLYSNTLAKQLLVNQGRLASWRNPQLTSGSMAELIDVIKGELVTTPAEQQAVISSVSPPLPFSLELLNRYNVLLPISPYNSFATPNLNLVSTWRNIEIVSPYNTGTPVDADGDALIDEQMGGPALALLTAQCSGKAVLIQRGTITFEAKVTNAIAAGAAMVILYNTNVLGDTSFSPAFTSSKTIPIFTMWNSIGESILTLLRGGKKLYATFETTTYRSEDNRTFLRITENQVGPSPVYPNTFSGVFDPNAVTYTVSLSKQRMLYCLFNYATNTRNEYRFFISDNGKVEDLKRYMIAGVTYRVIDELGNTLAPSIIRPINGTTAVFSNDIYSTDPAKSPNKRNILTLTSSRATQIRFTDTNDSYYSDYNINLGTNVLFLEEYDTSTPPALQVWLPYDTVVNARDLNTGQLVTKGGTPFQAIRYSCIITNVVYASGTLTFTADTPISYYIDEFQPPYRFYGPFNLNAGANSVNLSAIGITAPGVYGISNASTNTGGVDLATFTIP